MSGQAWHRSGLTRPGSPNGKRPDVLADRDKAS